MKNWEKNITKRFEANMLDGDEIKDSGVTLLNAKDCLEYFLEDIKENFISKQELADKVEGLKKPKKSSKLKGVYIWDEYNFALDEVIKLIKN